MTAPKPEALTTTQAVAVGVATGGLLAAIGGDTGVALGFWIGLAYAWRGEGRGRRYLLAAVVLEVSHALAADAFWQAALWWAGR